MSNECINITPFMQLKIIFTPTFCLSKKFFYIVSMDHDFLNIHWYLI